MHSTFVSLLNGNADLGRTILRAIFPKAEEALRVVDLCCNQASIIGPLNIPYITYVDIHPQPNLPPLQFIQMDVLDFEVGPVFDVATCMDGIEHLTKSDGHKLIQKMSAMAKCQIIFTPLGAFGIDKASLDPDVHKSLWQPWDFQGWQKLVFPAWHPALNCGAFWAWNGGHPDAMNRLIHGGMRLEPL